MSDDQRSIETERGNTKLSQSVQSKYWCFTFNNYTIEQLEQIELVFKGLDCKYILGREKGQQGTPHIQGYVESPKRCRWSEFKLPKGIHWEKRKGSELDNLLYCSKEKDFVVHGFIMPKVKRPIKVLDEKLLYNWQKDIIDIIKKEPDDRVIHWYWESKGCAGKTTFCKFLSHHYGAIPLEGKKNDILFCAAEFDSDIYLWDLERSMEEYVSYGALEKIKNGYFMCSKYESKPIIRNSPHVIVFANFPPDKDALSKDRWHIVDLGSSLRSSLDA